MDLKLIALRCPECRTLYEIPAVEIQENEVQEAYASIIDKLKFPCPNCGRYLGFNGPISRDDFK